MVTTKSDQCQKTFEDAGALSEEPDPKIPLILKVLLCLGACLFSALLFIVKTQDAPHR